METPAGSPDETFARFNQRFQIARREAEIVKSAWAQDRGYTMFHIINAYTRGAQHPELTAGESYRLEKTGGMILELVKQLFTLTS